MPLSNSFFTAFLPNPSPIVEKGKLVLTMAPTDSIPLDSSRGVPSVVAGFLVQFVVFGLLASFPVFIDAMEKDDTLGNPTKQNIAVVSSVAGGPGLIFGCLGGVVLDKVGPRPLLLGVTSALLIALLVAPTVSKSYGDLILLYSLPATLAVGFANSPVQASVGSWFDKHLALTMGITTCGGGLGSAVVPLASGALLNKYDWRTVWRLISLIDVLMATAAILISKRPHAVEMPSLSPISIRSHRSLVGDEDDKLPAARTEDDSLLQSNTSALKRSFVSADAVKDLKLTISQEFLAVAKECLTRPFVSIFISGIFFGFGYGASLFVVIPYALSFGKHANSPYSDYEKISVEKASSLYAWFGGAQAVGALVFGVCGYIAHPKAIYAISTLAVAAGCIGMAFSSTYLGLAVSFCIVGGAYAGTWSMFPAMMTERFTNSLYFGTVMGLSYVSIGIGGLAGPPVVAALSSNDVYYVALSTIAASSVIAAGVGFFCVPAAPPQGNAEEVDATLIP